MNGSNLPNEWQPAHLSDVDGLGEEAYNLSLMNYLISSRFTLSAILLGTAFSVVAEDLDAALAAQKEKTKRRVYSESALIDNRNLQVPTLPTDEEKALDRELELLEKRLNAQMTPAPQGMVIRRVPTVVPDKRENWLTPAMLDPDSDPLSDEKNPSWVDTEVERQKNLQLQKKALAEEEALLNKRLREESRQPYETPKLQQHETTFRNTITPGTATRPQRTVLNPLDSPRPKEPAFPSRTGSLFSPNARSSTGIIKPSSSPSTRTPDWQPTFDAPMAPTSLTSGFDVIKPAPLPPLKRVRKASPINQKDPFSDDFMPSIKTSIWD
ncbi:MAG: hypothetical protein JEZ10_06090 [Verrucomicrobia bacterium]|nr:hypothetical protein [Verrucomicrobiota bacterium]